MHVVLGALSAVWLVFLTLLCGGSAAILGLIKLAFPSAGKHFAPLFEWLVVIWSVGFTCWLALFKPAIEVEREASFRATKITYWLSTIKPGSTFLFF